VSLTPSAVEFVRFEVDDTVFGGDGGDDRSVEHGS
jgi:hypothetical protein